MRSKLISVSAAAIAALFLVASSVEQAAAQRGGRHGGGPSAGPSRSTAGGPSGAPRFEGRAPSGGRFEGRGPPAGSFSRDGSRSYSYAPRFDRRDRDGGRHHVRRFRGDRFLFGGVPFYGYTYYGAPCDYYYERAMATGSPYWWNRYYACTGEY
jgi:hypothetical protein